MYGNLSTKNWKYKCFQYGCKEGQKIHLNQEIKETIAKINQLRKDIDLIVSSIENEEHRRTIERYLERLDK